MTSRSERAIGACPKCTRAADRVQLEVADDGTEVLFCDCGCGFNWCERPADFVAPVVDTSSVIVAPLDDLRDGVPNRFPLPMRDALRAIRKRAGFTMERLAVSMGASKNVINHVENGRRATSLATVLAWADACDFDVAITFTPRGSS